MKLIRTVFLALFLVVCIHAKEDPINISFKDLSIMDLINITSKVVDKNILITQNIKGKVDFISNKPLYKKDIVNILIYVLESKGYTLVDNKNILRIVRIADTAKYNLPVFSNNISNTYSQMVTKVFNVEYSNVDYVSSKVRHLLTKSAKLVTDKESNSIVITDFPSNIKTVQKIIKLIAKDSKKTIEIVSFKNIKAAEASTSLKSIAKSVFNEKIEKEKVSILPNKDNNSIMIVGKLENVNFLKNYIINIDKKGSLIERVVEVIGLKNVESTNVIKIINSIIEKRKYVDPDNKPFASTDDESNSVVLMGPKDEVGYLQELIKKLDVDRPQVYVKAKIIEVNENKTKNIGIKYGLAGGASGSAGLFSFASNLGGVTLPAGDLSSMIDLPTNLTKGLALGATINLLDANQAVDIISEPSILCINNKECSIYVGETKSFQTGATSTTSSADTTNITFQREDVGLTLKVKPRISNSNKVTLEITAIVEDAKELKDGQTNPDTSKKELTTSAIVTNGENIIFGGYIKNTVDTVLDKVPLLGDLTIIGALFNNEKKVKNRINLIIIITPYIIPTSKDLSFVKSQLAQLRILEDRYTEDLKFRLEERKFDVKKSEFKRDKEKHELDVEKENLSKKKIELKEEKKLFDLKKMNNTNLGI